MSAPRTNVKKQTRRHRGPLIGITVALAIAGIGMLVLLTYVFDPDDTLVEDDAVVMEEPGPVDEDEVENPALDIPSANDADQ